MRHVRAVLVAHIRDAGARSRLSSTHDVHATWGQIGRIEGDGGKDTATAIGVEVDAKTGEVNIGGGRVVQLNRFVKPGTLLRIAARDVSTRRTCVCTRHAQVLMVLIPEENIPWKLVLTMYSLMKRVASTLLTGAVNAGSGITSVKDQKLEAVGALGILVVVNVLEGVNEIAILECLDQKCVVRWRETYPWRRKTNPDRLAQLATTLRRRRQPQCDFLAVSSL